MNFSLDAARAHASTPAIATTYACTRITRVGSSRAQARAGSRYPFLTQKERDVETGLDYFGARYYSSTQARFTSPDEFTGGPDELYYFADNAADNPTFYADLRRPQSLNKYQFSFNNPLRYIDPDGHDAEETDPAPDPPQGQDTKRIPIPRGPGPTPAEAQQTVDALQKAWEWPDPYLYPISQAIGTAPDPTMEPVPIPPLVSPEPQVQPMPPPPPSQAHKRKKQSTGKNKNHPKETERPGRPNTKERQNPNWRPRQRPPGWPKNKPWPPWRNPRPKDWPKYEPWPPKPKPEPEQPAAPKPPSGS